jgi:two-component system cell cycle sensor histidine kinase/response regulator CckA
MNNLSHAGAHREGAAHAAAGDGELQHPGRILVVDDDVAVGLILSRTLTRLGYESDVAGDGPKALSLFIADPAQYALVFLDFKLPGMDSGTVYRQIRFLRPDVPVVLMSGYNREDALDKSAGMDLAGFLHKPFTADTLRTALSSAYGAV